MLDGGDLSSREPSTIIRIVDDAIEVIREGAVKIDENGRRIKWRVRANTRSRHLKRPTLATTIRLMQNSIWIMGIAGEAGEIVEKWKKAVAYREGQI